MHRRIAPLALLFTACVTAPTTVESPPAAAPAEAAPAASSWSNFGDPVPDSDVIGADTFLANPAAYVDQSITVEGRISEVCQKAGCWMVMSHEDKHIRVRMKDHAFSVAKDSSGARCQVHGQVVTKQLDPAEVAHFASETRAGGVVPEHASVEGHTFEIIANGVRIAAGT